MAEPRTFAGVAWSRKGKVTRRERFLAEMNAVMPWARLVKLIDAHYLRKGNWWYLGMKGHMGTDKRSVVHSLVTTHAAEAKMAQRPSRRSEVFSWDKCARLTLALLKDVARSRRASPARALP